MVENFTSLKQESSEVEEKESLEGSDFEENLKRNLVQMMEEPSEKAIQVILKYSKNWKK